MEERALFGRFVWRGVNIDDVTIHPSRGSRINPTLKQDSTTGEFHFIIDGASALTRNCPLRVSGGTTYCLCLTRKSVESFLTRKSVERLPPPDTTNTEKAYQKICKSLEFSAEQCILLCLRKNYVPCWDKEFETFYRSFL